MNATFAPIEVRAARRCLLVGKVQGVGLRPAVYRLATQLGLCGEVRNVSEGLLIEIEGPVERIEEFVDTLPENLPAGASLDDVRLEAMPATERDEFVIAENIDEGVPAVVAPSDRAVCRECLEEARQSGGERRRRYPFVSCTSCGPRYSILTRLPFGREATSMAAFPLCSACRAEYGDTDDRRFHAQTNACAVCGPQCWLTDANGLLIGGSWLETVLAALRHGKLVGNKGVGGYQILGDAADVRVVRLLRQRKNRPLKPFALLVASIEHAEAIAELNAVERQALSDPANPIVLCRVRSHSGIPDEVHPGLDTLGLLLPTTPIHYLIASEFRKPLLCTSANREGDPLEIDASGVEQRLAGYCDLWLHHDRRIVRPLDDSIVRIMAGRVAVMRLARGYAPLRLKMPSNMVALACGGHQKGAIAWANGRQAALGPHLGDFESLLTRERFIDAIGDCQRLYQLPVSCWIHDAHPDYFPTRWVQEQPDRKIGVWHHHAHVAAAMIEHHLLNREVLGVSWDGTGLGPDGSIWGGEFLIATVRGFRRFAHLRPFPLPGGTAAVREPWRVAAVLLNDAIGFDATNNTLRRIGKERLAAVLAIAKNRRLSPSSTSAGRLFDGISALLLETDNAGYDGRPAMLLETVCNPREQGNYSIPIWRGETLEIDWRPLVAGLVADLESGKPPSDLAMRFHRSLARAIVEVGSLAPNLPILLSGGVFQNRVLVECVLDEWQRHPQCRSRFLGLPGMIPVNDGGLAAGQLAIGMTREKRLPCV